MDVAKVDQIARQHRKLATTGGPGAVLETDIARRHEAEALNRLFRAVEGECAAYCTSYNDAFGATRVRFEAHGDTVVIRSDVDQQDTLVFHYVVPSDTHPGGSKHVVTITVNSRYICPLMSDEPPTMA